MNYEADTYYQAQQKKKTPLWAHAIAWLIVGLPLIYVVGGAFLGSMFGPTSGDPSVLGSSAYSAALVSATRQAAIRELRDGRDAEFGPIYAKGSWACGTVNSRNGFGVKAGHQRFVGNGSGVVLEEAMKPGEMDLLWRERC